MRRKTKRRKSLPRVDIQWVPVLWFALILNTAAGLWFSPITALRKVRVVGALANDEGRIRAILERQRGIPFAKVSVPAVESWVLERPDSRSASLSGNIIGSGVLTVGYRRAVARFAGTRTLALSVDGVIYPSTEDLNRLPSIVLPDNGLPLSMGLVAPWPATKIAKVAIEAPGIMRAATRTESLQIKFIESGDVCLNGGSGTVRLGSSENLDKKLSVLQNRLSRNPLELDQVKRLVLVVPERPAKAVAKGQTVKRARMREDGQ